MSFDEMISQAQIAIATEDWETFGGLEIVVARYLLGLSEIPAAWRRQFFETFKPGIKRWHA